MSILTKILLALVVISIFPVLYMGAGVLSVNEIWRKKVASYEKAVAEEKKLVELLTHGDFTAQTSSYTPPLKAKGTLGVVQLTAARDSLKVGRSRMWYGTIDPVTINPADGTLTALLVTSERLPPATVENHGIKDLSAVYVFSNPPVADGIPRKNWQSAFDKNTHRYLGEFVVNNLVIGPEGLPADYKVPLKATTPLTAADVEAIRQGGADVVIYEAMPSDEHDVFLGHTDDEIRNYVPEKTVDQYLADGKDIEKFPALKADPALSLSVEDGVDPETGSKVKLFRRPLRRYDTIFRDAAELLDDINNQLLVDKKELEYAVRAEARGKEEGLKLDANKLAAEEELKVLASETAIAKIHLEELDAKVKQLTQELKTQLATNKRLTDEIAGRKTAALSPAAGTTALNQ